MNVLGISSFYHDSGACLVQDGRIVAAAQEERFSRIKHDPAFPARAIDWCLQQGGVHPSDVSLVSFYEKPLKKLDRILDTTMVVAPKGRKRFADAIPSWFLEKLRVQEIVGEHLGHEPDFIYAQHHESHAASAFFLSPFTDAAILTCDGVGEWATNTLGRGSGATIELQHQIKFPHSLGLLYSAFTQYLGFRVNNGEYKVMGLAPYGEPRFRDLILEHLIDLKADGSYRLHMEAFDFLHGDSTISPRFADVFRCAPKSPDTPLQQIHMDLARSIQIVTEEVILKQAAHLAQNTGESNLCMAGGVSLNSVANGKLAKSGLFENLWIQPAAGDAGGCLGAAMVAWHHYEGQPRTITTHDGMSGGYLGPRFDDEDIAAAIAAEGLPSEKLDMDALRERVSTLIARGGVVGWFQERMEFGPRALGSRSILADPRNAEMQPKVNAKIKFREGFRPFAPSVLATHCEAWFELATASPYMLLVVPVQQEQRRALTEGERQAQGFDKLKVARSNIPAVTHVDNSARVQTVDPETSPHYHALISEFHTQTGCPVMLNTSFNLRGEPIVCTPGDACRTFLASGMDALAIGPYLVIRPEDRKPTGKPPDPPVIPPTPKTEEDLRKFGVGGGIILILLAATQVWLDHNTAATVVFLVAALFAVPGMVKPELLREPEKVMMRVGKKIGHFNAMVLLSALYLLVVTPIGALRRLVAGDFLQIQLDPDATTYWQPADPSPRDEPDRYHRMY